MRKLDANNLIRRFVEIVENERESLVSSYCHPPPKGEDYDIETISERSAYDKVKRIDRAIADAKIILKQKGVRK